MSRQIERRKLFAHHFGMRKLDGHANHRGMALRKERRGMARALAAKDWKESAK